jgi:CBS domain-containing protein
MYSVADILNEKGQECWSVSPEATVFEALKVLAEKYIGAVLVMTNDKLHGIFTERDYARKVALKGKTSKDTLVKDMMTQVTHTVDPSASTSDCMKLMTDKRVRHLPVLDGEKLVGLVSIGDVVNKIIKEQKDTIQQLGSYISGG